MLPKMIEEQRATMDIISANVQWVSRDLLAAYAEDRDVKPRTWCAYMNCLQQFYKFCMDMGVTRPQKGHVMAWRENLMKYCKASTVAQYLSDLGRYFAFLERRGIYPNICEGVKRPTVSAEPTRRPLKPEAVSNVAHGIDTSTEQGARLMAMYLLAVVNGLRTIELHRANVGDYRRKDGVLMLWGKGRDAADVSAPLPADTMRAIDHYLSFRGADLSEDAPLFVATGNRSGGQRIASTTISKMLKKAMVQAGYDDPQWTAHSLRHTAADTALRASGNNIFVVQHLLRHSSPTITQRYLHYQAMDEQRNVMADMLRMYQRAGIRV